MNSQSRGQIKLKSADPIDPPSVDPKYLSHPYDVVNLREALREGLKLMQTPTMKEHFVRPIFAPKSDSDEDIVVCYTVKRPRLVADKVQEFIEQNVAGLWHPSCSVRMGKTEQDGSCVDADLKVHGLSGLRVADLSVTSMLPRYV